jgi:hypothetical protein
VLGLDFIGWMIDEGAKKDDLMRLLLPALWIINY